jgi:hypothetical protein
VSERAALIDIDALFDEQLRRISRRLDRVGARIDEAASSARRASLVEAYAEADTLARLAQIAGNSGRVVLPGLDAYDSRTNATSVDRGRTTCPVDRAAGIRRKYAVNYTTAPAEREPRGWKALEKHPRNKRQRRAEQ